MKGDYKYETMSEKHETIDHLLDNNRTRLCKSYYQILEVMDKMDEYLRRAGEHPVELSKDHATRVQNFLEKTGEVLQDYEPLFNEMDE